MRHNIHEYIDKDEWKDVIVQYSGLFESVYDRHMFILDVALKNPILATDCIAVSLIDEEKLTNTFTIICVQGWINRKCTKSLLSIILLEEYAITLLLLESNSWDKLDTLLSGKEKKEDFRFIKPLKDWAISPIEFIRRNREKFSDECFEEMVGLLTNKNDHIDLSYFKLLMENARNDSQRKLSVYNDFVEIGGIPDCEMLNILLMNRPSEERLRYSLNQFEYYNISPNVLSFREVCKSLNHWSDCRDVFLRVLENHNSHSLRGKLYFEVYSLAYNACQRKSELEDVHDLFYSNVPLASQPLGREFLFPIILTQEVKLAETFSQAKFLVEAVPQNKLSVNTILAYIEKFDDMDLLKAFICSEEFQTAYWPDLSKITRKKSIEQLNEFSNLIFHALLKKVDVHRGKWLINLIEYQISREYTDIRSRVANEAMRWSAVHDVRAILSHAIRLNEIRLPLLTRFLVEMHDEKSLAYIKSFIDAGLMLNQILYNVYIKKTDSFSFACRVLDEMIENGFEPDSYTCSSAIKKCKKSSELFIILNKCFPFIPNVSKKTQDDIVAFSSKHFLDYQEYILANEKQIRLSIPQNWQDVVFENS